ncbi:hypothetical protein G7Y79_00003g011570 [Physcia stellaris]|nr:hypothetical protein G7Y79_00003g011570 [Physcia stellaris]
MSQRQRADDMRRMLGVLNSGLKLAGQQFTLEDGVFSNQMPTPPVHNLYEGFDNIGKTLTAFEKTMSEVSDTYWRESAKPGGERMPDDLEDEDWIKANAAKVPDPKPPIEILEGGFVALHGTFDAFESFMKKQHKSKEGEVLAVPAELSRVIPQTLNTDTEAESESKEKGHIGQNLAKHDVSPNDKLDDRQSILTVRKHPYNNQDPANGDGLPPLKRRAVSGQERGTVAVGDSAFSEIGAVQCLLKGDARPIDKV